MKIFFLKLLRVIFLALGFDSLKRAVKHVTSEFFRILLLLVLALAPAWGWAQNLVVDPFFSNPSASWIYSAPNFTTPGAAIRGTTPTAVTTAGGTKAFESGCVGAACLTFPVVPGTSSSASQAVPTTIGEGYVLVFGCSALVRPSLKPTPTGATHAHQLLRPPSQAGPKSPLIWERPLRAARR